MNDQLPQVIKDKIRALHNERRALQELTPEQKMDAILDHRECTALVHSFPEQDLFYLIHEIGAEDAMPILSLASDRQWEYILDLELWNNDRLDIHNADKWLFLMHKADPNRLTKWIMEDVADDFRLGDRLQLLEFYLNTNIETVTREHDQDPAELGEDFFTFDDIYYVRVKQRIDEAFSDETLSAVTDTLDEPVKPSFMAYAERREFISDLLNRFAGYDHVKYQKILMESAYVIPAEMEEGMYRFRSVRLAEKGFVPFEESVGIYAPLSESDIINGSRKVPAAKDESTELGIMVRSPMYPESQMAKDGPFIHALQKTAETGSYFEIQSEFVTLLNQLITADAAPVRDKEELSAVVRKACGYLSVGLESIAEAQNLSVDAEKYAHAASWLTAYPLKNLFRAGFGRALKLKWKAEKWRKEAWFSQMGLSVAFWDEKRLGLLGGLFLEKPLYYNDYETGVLYREFESLSDIKKTDDALDEVIRLDDLFKAMDIRISGDADGFLTYKKALLTPFAAHVISRNAANVDDHEESQGIALETLSLFQLKTFFKHLFKPVKSALLETDDGKEVSIIHPGMEKEFISWISDKTGMPPYELSLSYGNEFDTLFRELENEYGHMKSEDLDPRFIHYFLMGLL